MKFNMLDMSSQGAIYFALVWLGSTSFAQETNNLECSDSTTCTESNFKAQIEYQNDLIRELETQLEFSNVKDCYDILNEGYTTSNVYTINTGHFSIQRQKRVFCNMDIDGGGWTVVQRRMDGSENFRRNWEDFKHGFGNISGEFWIGNKNLYGLTKNRNYQVRFDLGDWEGNWRYAEYSYFFVLSEKDNYKLLIGSYTGNAGDSFDYHNEAEFSTYDREHDSWSDDCIDYHGYGGFWLNQCMDVGINNYYAQSSSNYGNTDHDKIRWDAWHGHTYSLKYTSMMIRPID